MEHRKYPKYQRFLNKDSEYAVFVKLDSYGIPQTVLLKFLRHIKNWRDQKYDPSKEKLMETGYKYAGRIRVLCLAEKIGRGVFYVGPYQMMAIHFGSEGTKIKLAYHNGMPSSLIPFDQENQLMVQTDYYRENGAAENFIDVSKLPSRKRVIARYQQKQKATY